MCLVASWPGNHHRPKDSLHLASGGVAKSSVHSVFGSLRGQCAWSLDRRGVSPGVAKGIRAPGIWGAQVSAPGIWITQEVMLLVPGSPRDQCAWYLGRSGVHAFGFLVAQGSMLLVSGLPKATALGIWAAHGSMILVSGSPRGQCAW